MHHQTGASFVIAIFTAFTFISCDDGERVPLPQCDSLQGESGPCINAGGSGGGDGGTGAGGSTEGGKGGSFGGRGGSAGGKGGSFGGRGGSAGGMGGGAGGGFFPGGAGGSLNKCTNNDHCGGASFCEIPGNSCGRTLFLVAAPPQGGSSGGMGTAGAQAPRPELVGFCAAQPGACSALFAPVCGCDGQTYENDCHRKRAGVSKRSDTACDNSTMVVGEGGTCGVFSGTARISCARGLFCEQDAKVCSMAGARGVCRAVPEQCVGITAPVCGCDNKTYQNDCIRRQAGQPLAHAGACGPVTAGPGQACGTALGILCGKDLVCDPGAHQCGTNKFVGVCRSQAAAACTADFFQVCGCDGRTYDNDCLRLSAGVTLDHEEACKTPIRLVSQGVWGGPHVELIAKDPASGGFLKFDCGSADIVSPLEVDGNGNFMWKAQYRPGGGPAVVDPAIATRPAIITGATDGKFMKFSVQIVGAAEQPTFGAQLGTSGTFTFCL